MSNAHCTVGHSNDVHDDAPTKRPQRDLKVDPMHRNMYQKVHLTCTFAQSHMFETRCAVELLLCWPAVMLSCYEWAVVKWLTRSIGSKNRWLHIGQTSRARARLLADPVVAVADAGVGVGADARGGGGGGGMGRELPLLLMDDDDDDVVDDMPSE